jgi:hypothetical protein
MKEILRRVDAPALRMMAGAAPVARIALMPTVALINDRLEISERTLT